MIPNMCDFHRTEESHTLFCMYVGLQSQEGSRPMIDNIIFIFGWTTLMKRKIYIYYFQNMYSTNTLLKIKMLPGQL